MVFSKFIPVVLTATCLFFASEMGLLAQAPPLKWSSNGEKCLFSSKDEDGVRAFRIVDIPSKKITPAFDQELVAKVLSKELGKDIAESNLPVARVSFADGESEALVLSGAEGSWFFDLRTSKISKTDASSYDESTFFMPPRASASSSEQTSIRIENQLDHDVELFWLQSPWRMKSYGSLESGKEMPMSTYVGHVWLIKDAGGKPLACFNAEAGGDVVITKDSIAGLKERAAKSRGGRRSNRGAIRSESSEWEAVVKDHDLWLRPKSSDGDSELKLLADDAVASNSFSRRPLTSSSGSPSAYWSPDAKYLTAVQRTAFEKRKVHYVESSPKDRLQPLLREYTYPKPGDPVVEERYRLFSVDDQKEIPVSNELCKSPYWIRLVKWSEAGDKYWLHYCERGHKVIRLLEVAVPSGQMRVIAENTSDTFLEQTVRSKLFYEFLENDKLLWASQRSGWNHIYLIDRTTGKVITPVTSGDWNVKRIEQVDLENRQLWFYAVGVYPDQDPYHEHLCRVDFDGGNFKVLTQGDGTHKVAFEQDRKYFVDTWSRVDQPPVHELRDSSTGELIRELSRDKTSGNNSKRPLPTRFTAAGRDGETDIWGIIHFPKDFAPDKKYPVVENIYAGPHDHHVPKAFRSSYYTQHRIADAGMIVVQIDGMGTSWRSKKFHDVCYKNLKDAGFLDRIAWMKAAAKTFPQMDISRVGIYGGSAGGQNAMAALLWHNDFYSVAVADCGCHDNRMDKMWWNEQWMGYPIDESYEENSNTENAHLLKGHLMLTVGEKDENVDPASTTQVVNALIKADKDFEFVLIPGGGHGSGESPWAAKKRLNFLKRHLGAE